jgi:hypothetical protein
VQPVLVPKDRLSPEALVGLVDAFVLREGTDYGHADRGLDEKRTAVLAQIDRGEVVIVFDPSTEDVNLVLARELPPELAG